MNDDDKSAEPVLDDGQRYHYEGRELVQVAEVATYFGVSDNTVYTWAKRRRLPSYRAGRALLFNMGEAIAWAERTGVVRKQLLHPVEHPKVNTTVEQRVARIEQSMAAVQQEQGASTRILLAMQRALEQIAARPAAAALPGGEAGAAGKPAAPATPTFPGASYSAHLEHLLDAATQRIVTALGQNDRAILSELEAVRADLRNLVGYHQKLWDQDPQAWAETEGGADAAERE